MSYAAFRWSSTFRGEDLQPGHTTLIESTVTPIDEGVQVSVIESGFGWTRSTSAGRRASNRTPPAGTRRCLRSAAGAES
jgi:hypothetical protein